MKSMTTTSAELRGDRLRHVVEVLRACPDVGHEAGDALGGFVGTVDVEGTALPQRRGTPVPGPQSAAVCTS